MSEQQIRLALEVLGQGGVEDLRKQLRALNDEGGQLAAALGRGEVSLDDYNAEMRRLAAGAKGLEAQLDKLDKAAKKGGGGMAGFGQSALQTGRIVQDFAQGGLGGIINNLEGFATAIGGGPGLAGVLTVLGTGFLILKPRIKEFLDSLEGGSVKEFSGQLETLNDRIKELEDKEHKVSVDFRDLETAKAQVDEIKRALAEVERLRKNQSYYEKQSGASIAGMLEESPGGSQAVLQKLRGSMQGAVLDEVLRPMMAEEAALKAKIAETEEAARGAKTPEEAVGLGHILEGLRADLERRETNRVAAADDVIKPGGVLDNRIGKLLERAEKGSGVDQARAQRDLVAALEAAGLGRRAARGGGGLAAGVEAAGPEQQLLNDQADDELERSIEDMKDARKARKEAEERRKRAINREVDELNREGREHEAQMKADQAKERKADRAAGKADKDDVEGMKLEAHANEGLIDAEVKKIRDTLGKQMQSRFELLMGGNAALLANGGPVARTDAQEKAFRRAGGVAGRDYAIDPKALEARLRGEMAGIFKRRGAGEQAANLASRGIGDAGKTDLARRSADFGAQNLTIAQQTLMITRQLQAEYERMSGIQRQLVQEAQLQGRKMQAGQRNARKR